jgi:hypothetical protein
MIARRRVRHLPLYSGVLKNPRMCVEVGGTQIQRRGRASNLVH